MRDGVPGMQTFLMQVDKGSARTVTGAALAASGISAADAWQQADATMREMMKEISVDEVAEDPTILALLSENSLAMHAALLLWKSEWTGKAGSLLMGLDGNSALIGVCNAADDVPEALGRLTDMLASLEDAPEETTFIWRDAQGFEVLGSEGEELIPGPRLKAVLGTIKE